MAAMAVVVMALLAPGMAAAAVRAGGPPAPPAPSTSRILLVSQSPWITPGQDLVLGLRITDKRPPDELEVAVTLCARVSTRSEFALTLDDKGPCTPIDVVNPSLSSLPVAADGSVTLTMPVTDRVADQPGVYPARVELRERRGKALDHLTTHVITVPATTDPKLGASIVLPLATTVSVSRSGMHSADPVAADHLVALVSSLQNRSAVPVTLDPSPASLQLLAGSTRPADSAAIESLAGNASSPTRQFVAGPYVPVSLPALNAAGLESEVAAQVVRGSEALEDILQERPDPRTWVALDPLDAASVASLGDRGVDRLVLPEASLQPLAINHTLTQPFTLEARQGRRVAAAAGDSGLVRHFAPTDQPVLAAHQLLADLAVIYFDAPNVKNRGVVALPPSDWRPDPAFLDTLLDGLGTSPVLAPMTLDTLFTTVSPAAGTRGRAPLVRTLAPLRDSAANSLPATPIRTSRHKLDSFGSILDRDNQQAADLFDDLERSLLAAESSDVRGRDRTAAVDAVERRLDHQLAMVHMPASRSITLTARQGEIPVTVLSDAPFPVHVTIDVQSDKLRFPGGEHIDLPPLTRRVTTLRVTVQSRTSGSFPLRVTVRTPSGAVLSQSRISVRSTATSGVGVVLSVGAGAFLFLWWLRQFRHGRRARALVPV
jgi:hypothetical protein